MNDPISKLAEAGSYRPGNNVQWICGGKDFFDAMAALIEAAQKHIHLQTYILENDDTGQRIMDALKRAAQRGVDVFVVVDAFGSGALPRHVVQEMETNGIVFRRFEPVLAFHNLYFGRRLHHKILVADGHSALVGGINIADKYHGTLEKPPWLDYAVLVSGEGCAEILGICRRILGKRYIPGKVAPLKKNVSAQGAWVRVRQNDWMRRKYGIYRSYSQAIKSSQDTVIIVGGYFLPGRRFLTLLKHTALRGVKIKIILTCETDVLLTKYATRYLYAWLLRNNIQIYEWQKSVVHGKAAVVDKTWSTLGSYNLNFLSLYASIELNLDVLDVNFSTSFHSHLEEIISKGCKPVTPESHAQNENIFSKFFAWTAYIIMRALTFITLLFTGGREPRQ